MSFNFSGPNFRPMIQEAQSMQNNGGGGNTGYFQRGKKKKEEEIDVFNTEDPEDVFISSEHENADNGGKEENIIEKLVDKVKEKISPKQPKPEFGKLSQSDEEGDWQD